MQQEGVRYLAGRERGRAGTCPPQGTGGMRSRSSPGRHPEQGAARAFPRGCSHAQPRSPSRASRTDPSLPVKTPLSTLWDGSRRCLGGVWLQILWKNPLEHAVPQFPPANSSSDAPSPSQSTQEILLQNQPIIPHLTLPSRARESSRGFYPPAGSCCSRGDAGSAQLSSARLSSAWLSSAWLARGAEPSPRCSQLVLLPAAP